MLTVQERENIGLLLSSPRVLGRIEAGQVSVFLDDVHLLERPTTQETNIHLSNHSAHTSQNQTNQKGELSPTPGSRDNHRVLT